MQAFTQYTPTKVIFGAGTEAQAPTEIVKAGGSRVLVVYGGGSVVRSGLLAKVEAGLSAAGLVYETLGGVQPNPRLSLAREGVKKAIAMKADFILAVGGGSVIDTAKAVAHGCANPETDIWEFWSGRQKVTKTTPVGVILTISAAGSEMSDSAVLTNEELGYKCGLGTDFNRPVFAVMDPELTYTLPPYQVACGIVDIMMHTLDRYFTPTTGNELTDALAEALLRTVIANGTKAMENSRGYGPMSELMWAGSLSHNGLTGLGAAKDFVPHKLGHELSARFDVAHGASLSTVWGAWAEYSCGEHPERFVRYAREVWGITRDDPQDAVKAGIEATVAYFKSLGMPTCFTELGIGVQEDEVLQAMANQATKGDTVRLGSFRSLNAADAAAVYRLANR